LIVTGMPGAGMSTVTRLVADRLDGDDVNEMIMNGMVGPLSEPADEAERQLLLRAKNLYSLANNFAEHGFTPVIDHVVPSRDVLDFMIGRLRPRPVLLVVLAPTLAECRHRNATRVESQRVDYDFGFLGELMRQELSDPGWWFDMTNLTPDETADQILEQAAERAAMQMAKV